MMTKYHREVWIALCDNIRLGEWFTATEGARMIQRDFPNRTFRGLQQAVDKVLRSVYDEAGVGTVRRDGKNWSL